MNADHVVEIVRPVEEQYPVGERQHKRLIEGDGYLLREAFVVLSVEVHIIVWL